MLVTRGMVHQRYSSIFSPGHKSKAKSTVEIYETSQFVNFLYVDFILLIRSNYKGRRDEIPALR